jgi:hypothetical protein
MKSLASNAPLAIAAVVSVILLVMAHELLSAIAGADRFAPARKWLIRASVVTGLVVTVLIFARFYYLRAA